MKALEMIRLFASGEIEHEKCGVCHIGQEVFFDIKALFGDVLKPVCFPRESYYLWIWCSAGDEPDFARADYCLIPSKNQNERIFLFAIEN